MKISILEIIGDSTLAGAPRHLLSILEHIDRKKFDLHVICHPGPLAGEIRKKYHYVDLDVIAMRSRMDFEAIKKIRKVMKHIKPDIIHVHGTRGGVLGRFASIGLNIPVIYTEHLWTSQYKTSSRIIDFLHYNAYWFLDMFTTQNIAVSGAVKDFMISSHITRAEKVKVIYNGIEPTKYQAKIFQSEKEFLLATVGTLNENKGMQFLIKALPRVIKEYPGIRLEIIGDGGYKYKLLKLVKHLKLKNYVKFTGFVPDVEKYLTRFDIYIQPSLSESFGLAILQAMSVGLPVVATTTGGIPEVVTQDKSGILVEPGNDKELSAAILDLIRNPGKAKKIGSMAEKEAKLKFNIKDMIIELETTYEEIQKNPAFSE
jgi:glycosyltransferase involved in cell wall biosynthesis